MLGTSVLPLVHHCGKFYHLRLAKYICLFVYINFRIQICFDIHLYQTCMNVMLCWFFLKGDALMWLSLFYLSDCHHRNPNNNTQIIWLDGQLNGEKGSLISLFPPGERPLTLNVPFEPLKIRLNTRGHAPLTSQQCPQWSTPLNYWLPFCFPRRPASTRARCCTSTTCPGRSRCATTGRGRPTTPRRARPVAVCWSDSRCLVESFPSKVWISFVHQGGGACHDIEECTRRCEEDGVPLCSSKNARDQIQMGGRASVWSPLPEENPAFHDWYKVYFNPLKLSVLSKKENPAMH